MTHVCLLFEWRTIFYSGLSDDGLSTKEIHIWALFLIYENVFFRDDTNLFEAAANGSMLAGKTMVAVVVSFISFLGMLAFVNATLGWFGSRVGYDDLTFEASISIVHLCFFQCLQYSWMDSNAKWTLIKI